LVPHDVPIVIAVGSPAPEFEGKDSKGETFRLSSLRGRQVVLYFFPKAFTGGCTLETRQLGALAPDLAAKGVQVVGVSVDSEETQHRFAAHCQASFPLVSDRTKSISRSYGVLSLLGFSKRVTFYLDESGVVRDVMTGMLPGPHLARTKARFLSPP
jgi:thioredoxin-dependent peroxiredoxin